ncbi:MAG: phosphatase PAP2 family protein [Rhizobiaceae bacterium]|nr:phosphatase PAP2 family protein [Rhizobiaceae bacterium]
MDAGASKPRLQVVSTARRAWRNLDAMFERAFARWRTRPSIAVRISWLWPLAWVAAIAILMLTVDQIAGELRHSWPLWLLIPALHLTDVGLSGWYLLPATAVVAAACLIDWTKLPRRGKALLANWTALAFLVLVGIGLSGLVQIYLKSVFGRARMRYFDELGAFHFEPNYFDDDLSSFPSGHSATMGAFAAIVALLFPSTRVFVIPFAVLVSLTRVVTRAHYPSDVVAGFGLGFAGALAAAFLFARMGLVFRGTQVGFVKRRSGFRLFPRRRGSAGEATRPAAPFPAGLSSK